MARNVVNIVKKVGWSCEFRTHTSCVPVGWYMWATPGPSRATWLQSGFESDRSCCGGGYRASIDPLPTDVSIAQSANLKLCDVKLKLEQEVT